MTLSQLQYFVSLAETRSVSKSASLLNVSRPTISRSINELEDEFGVMLFIKESNSLVLTEAGQYCFEKSKEILRWNESLVSQMNVIRTRISSSDERTVKLGISPASAKLVYPDLVSMLYERYPDINLITLEYEQVQSRASLADGSMDFHLAADGSWKDLPNGIKTIPLLKSNYVCCVSKNHELAKRKFITIQEVSHYPLASFARYFDRPPFLGERFRENSAELNIVYHSEQLSALREFISGGFAYSAMLHGMIDDGKDIIGIPFEPPIIWTISLAYNELQPKNSACADFIKVAKDYQALRLNKSEEELYQ